MENEKNNVNDTTEPVIENTDTEESKESVKESLITPEIEENPDLEDPRLYSPLVDTDKPDPRIEGGETADEEVEEDNTDKQ